MQTRVRTTLLLELLFSAIVFLPLTHCSSLRTATVLFLLNLSTKLHESHKTFKTLKHRSLSAALRLN